MSERPNRIGICFNDYEPFYWDADKEDTCPGCPVEDDDEYATHEKRIDHRFYVIEASLTQAEQERDEARRQLERPMYGPEGRWKELRARAESAEEQLTRVREWAEPEIGPPHGPGGKSYAFGYYAATRDCLSLLSAGEQRG